MDQPDFSRIWREHFSTLARGVSYRVRDNACFGHDLMFLSSLIHDARIIGVDRTPRELSLQLERDRWELFDGSNLPTIQSVLAITGGVLDWLPPPGDLPWIDHFYLSTPYPQESNAFFLDLDIKVSGRPELLRIQVPDLDRLCIQLRDSPD